MRDKGNVGQTGEQPPGQPYADGWPQLKADLAHLWGFPLGRDLQCSHQWTSIHKACGEIQDPEKWGREGESLENERVKYNSEILYLLNMRLQKCINLPHKLKQTG